MRLRNFLAAGALALLTGCAALAPHETLEGQGNQAGWDAHKTQVSALDGW